MESRISSLSLSETTHQSHQSSGTKSSPSPVSRLWRPAAQRNVKSQWSRLNSLRQEWVSSSSTARSHATSVVNAYLSQRYMKDMELGVLSDMPDIQKRARGKLLKQQVLHRDKLVSSYKDMGSVDEHWWIGKHKRRRRAHQHDLDSRVLERLVFNRDGLKSITHLYYDLQVTTVVNMVNASTSMRCYLKGATNSPLIQFSSSSEDTNDNGDGGGMPVFTFWSISSFEKSAWELVQTFKLELCLKRLLVIEFLSLRSKEDPIIKRLCWSDEIYQGEFDNLSRCDMDCREGSESAPQKLYARMFDTPVQPNGQPESDILQVYLTTWLTDINIDKRRMEDIFCEVGEEMHVSSSW